MSEQQHEAGRETDALVARVVFGWVVEPRIEHEMDPAFFSGHAASMYRVIGERPYLVPPGMVGKTAGAREEIDGMVIGGDLPAYSTDIAAAMTVVEKIGGYVDLLRRDHSGDYVEWIVWIESRGEATAPTLPLAICRAALAAAEGQS